MGILRRLALQSRDGDGLRILLAGSLGAMANGTTRGQQWYTMLSLRVTATSREYIAPISIAWRNI